MLASFLSIDHFIHQKGLFDPMIISLINYCTINLIVNHFDKINRFILILLVNVLQFHH